MPPEVQSSLQIDSVLTIIGIICAMAGQSWVFLRWLNREFRTRDEALTAAVHERNRELQNVSGKVDMTREYSRGEIARLDRDLSGLWEKLAVMPSRKDVDDIIRERVGPMEADLRALVIELARIGVTNGKH